MEALMPICKNCGTQNSDTSSFCINCGAPVDNTAQAGTTPTPQPAYANPQPQGGGSASGKSIAALILGILSIVGSCGPVTGIIAIILANQELRAIQDGQSPEAGKTLCQVGLWTGWIGTIACGLFWIGYIGIIIFAIAIGH
jgi:hypothetical protein